MLATVPFDGVSFHWPDLRQLSTFRLRQDPEDDEPILLQGYAWGLPAERVHTLLSQLVPLTHHPELWPALQQHIDRTWQARGWPLE
jgi:hypothetical protein